MSQTVGFIFARGGSKGIPGKNIRPLGGRPLIAWSIDTALESRMIERVVVSTDDPEIAAIARDCGAETPFLRPAELARDDSPEWLAWRHAITALPDQVGMFVSLSPTAPLRSVEDVERCIEMASQDDCDIAITVTPAGRSPWFNMVVRTPDGACRLVNRSAEVFHNRQQAPEVFDMTTVAYAARPAFILDAGDIFEGRVKAVVVPRERAVDIDTELDMKFAEFLLSQRDIPGPT